jgi:hypothetical protein
VRQWDEGRTTARVAFVSLLFVMRALRKTRGIELEEMHA